MSDVIAPVIKVKGSQWIVQCPYCNKKHTHGPFEGYRVPHCDDSAFNRKEDYYVKLPKEQVR